MEKNMFAFQPEIWGGIECTINRVHDHFFDQLEFVGHYGRLSDLDLIASCGIRTLRVPILWEKHQPSLSNEISWDWAEKLLEKQHEHGITPIVGLLHHGSGPAFTNLSDPNFPNLFANYAYLVARKFPFIEYYTPINEPLTTARFSGLYGHWYPHKKSSYDFAKMLLNELKGIVLAMDSIRTVNRHAKLIQTEDLAKTYSRSTLKYQADFENIRRWLTYDFLFGKINSEHPMYKYLLYLGFADNELSFLLADSCPPHILGVNYYVTSERFLDDAIENYPSIPAEGNGKDRYVDVEAIRVRHDSKYGLELLLKECWKRYETEIAITEIHLNCHREQQLRWFKQAFDTCTKLKREGVDVRAITAWALLGAFGWNKLVTDGKGQYETGSLTWDPASQGPQHCTPLSNHIIITTAEKTRLVEALAGGRWAHDFLITMNWS
jgi:dTDP-4-dehydrorhamnose reductase